MPKTQKSVAVDPKTIKTPGPTLPPVLAEALARKPKITPIDKVPPARRKDLIKLYELIVYHTNYDPDQPPPGPEATFFRIIAIGAYAGLNSGPSTRFNVLIGDCAGSWVTDECHILCLGEEAFQMRAGRH